MKYFRDFFNPLLVLEKGGVNSGSLNKAVYEIIQVAGMIVGLIAAVINALSAFHYLLILSNIAFVLMLLVSFYLSRVMDRVKISKYVSISAYILFFLPSLWIFNGGSVGGSPLYFLCAVSFIVLLVTGSEEEEFSQRHRIIFLSLVMFLFCSLLLLEAFIPESIHRYPSEKSRYIDLFFSFIFAAFINYFILKVYIKHYNAAMSALKDYSLRLEGLVQKDSMTNLFNHAFILQLLNEEVTRARRYNRKLAIMMLDIDDFKKINDTFGHQFGDRVIKTIADIILSSCRSTDIAGRYGGEEFLVIFPETGLLPAITVGERIRKALLDEDFDDICSVTFSAGVVELHDESHAELLKKSDSLLYRAKSLGKDQIQSGRDIGCLNRECC